MTEGAVIAKSGRIVTIFTDNTTLHAHQVETGFDVKSGERIEITYDITTDAGEIIKLGLLNSQRNNFYPQQVLLTMGRQEGAFVGVVPEGECKVCLMFYNVCETSASTQFTIRSLKIKIFPQLL